MDFDDIFERILQVFLIIFLGVGLLVTIGTTIYLFKRDIIGPYEYTKLLEQSLNEQLQEKQVYMNMLEEERSK